VKADTAVAGALPVREGALLTGWRKQRYIGGARLCLQVPACPGACHGTKQLYASSTKFPLSGELPVPRPTAGTARDPQITGWQTVRTRSVDCTRPAAAAANPR
jgi:hypothetical protein